LAQATEPAAPAAVAGADDKVVTTTRVYDLRDLVMSIGDYPFTGRMGAPTENVLVIAGERSGPTTQPTRAERLNDFMKLITETVDTDSWRDNGGTSGAMRELSGLLVIT